MNDKKEKWVALSRSEEVADIGLDSVAELILSMTPTLTHLVERQTRTEFMWQLAEELGAVPKGMNELGDLLMDRLRNDKEVIAIREVAEKSRVVPLEYAQKVKSAKGRIRNNDTEIANMIGRLIIDG
tara:strand:+ start:187 stop:567 length:381 start_codon:yes stop_codon:yes gene_type:complete